jgi:tetratricopeptide (TPR) repeat protein
MKSITCIVFIYSLTILVSAGDVSDFDRANHLLYQKRFEEAVKTYTKFIIEHPDNQMVPAAQWTLANLKMDLYKQYEDALKLYEQIIHDHANSSWEIYSYETAGRCYETLEKWQEAAESYQKLFMKLKGTTIEYFAERRIGEIKRRLLNCYQQLNNSQNLIDLYQGFIKENPESVEDYFGLANAYLDLDQKELAAENFVKIVEYFPAAPQARQVHSQHKDLLETKKNFNWHLYEIFESGYQASRSTDYEKALTDFNQVLQAGSQVVTATSREQYTSVPIYRGRLLKTTEIAKDILDADVFINIPIAKHHRQSDITIGMKNLMGIIWDRGYFHSHGLHQTIADLCTTVKPDLTVVDANRVLITNGPAGPGKIIEAKTVIAGTDPVAVDAWCARYFNKEPQEIGHIQFAYEMGVGELRLNKLNIKEFQVG